ncbi:PH domain-containing protein [Methylobacterium sp. UNC300MFChir4.1]|uniref:photosynthetic complex putative assembly protein PuhB n=1 Tax=Methylobacterium sp. UNC300MFChir4.1 TaxID=1502747 RepID=UPI0008D1353A|nr:photosynthetic complex putative assembly protein PuhB [Methylobacterium sp. UNC300MFChir4.1]SEO74134.1 PH domain-containing protein [Methylobacterium sp. UNC300MFChir4.1]
MTMRIPHPAAPAGAPTRPVGVRLEPGERILWQGRPLASALRRHLLKGRWLAAYFVLLLGWKLALIVALRGLRPQEVFDTAVLLAQGAALAVILAYLAWALARSTTYTVTSLRIVIRHGIALQGSVDIPMRAIRSVAVRIHHDGTGDVALTVRDGAGVGLSKLWPHVRGLNLSAPVPMLRGLPDAAVLGTQLARRLDGPTPALSEQDVRPLMSPHATAA